MIDVSTSPLAPTTAGDAAALARSFGLEPVGRRPPITAYVRKLWAARHFIRKFAYLRYRAENHADLLGAAWNVLRPLLQAGVYTLIFGVLLKVAPSSGGLPARIMFITAGVFIFNFTSGAVTSGARSVTSNINLVRALPFARASLPIAVVLQEAIAAIPAYIALCFISILTHPPTVAWVVIVPVLVLQAFFNLGVVFVVARFTAHVRDFAQLLPFIIRIWFYMSGVFYAVQNRPSIKDHPIAETLLTINPTHVFIEIVRKALIYGRFEIWEDWALGIAWAVGMFVVGFVFFWRAEESYARD